uniref:Uncharacterized protein n=1 Tax=Chromera velia CCMP2878 TaxID=1169474 RepID=A0A0G4HVI1_9ALVE|eukprot:Cvel_8858.t1-p1 / transcript=Cvel_8858.t1 / gene=Cvel_8858 / organism=Chromera_velia_CCMP2878 / gene_product=hypothetical protein / transcript_product=hypothetical protein / location=Cvel_scaffold498:11702-20652(+) / protein_length=1466 / sequence_SO=supercontig / SO=protein_coding / is_pseudo=false
MSGCTRGVPEIVDPDGAILERRTSSLHLFDGLGPPDLCVLWKYQRQDTQTLSRPASAHRSVAFCHFVVGQAVHSLQPVAAYLSGCIMSQEEREGQEKDRDREGRWQVEGGVYCCFDFVKRADVRVEVRLGAGPARQGVRAFAVFESRLEEEVPLSGGGGAPPAPPTASKGTPPVTSSHSVAGLSASPVGGPGLSEKETRELWQTTALSALMRTVDVPRTDCLRYGAAVGVRLATGAAGPFPRSLPPRGVEGMGGGRGRERGHTSAGAGGSAGGSEMSSEKLLNLVMRFVVGQAVHSLQPVAAYLSGCIMSQEEREGQEKDRDREGRWQVEGGVYCCFDFVKRADVRVEVRLGAGPARQGVRAFAVFESRLEEEVPLSGGGGAPPAPPTASKGTPPVTSSHSVAGLSASPVGGPGLSEKETRELWQTTALSALMRTVDVPRTDCLRYGAAVGVRLATGAAGPFPRSLPPRGVEGMGGGRGRERGHTSAGAGGSAGGSEMSSEKLLNLVMRSDYPLVDVHEASLLDLRGQPAAGLRVLVKAVREWGGEGPLLLAESKLLERAQAAEAALRAARLAMQASPTLLSAWLRLASCLALALQFRECLCCLNGAPFFHFPADRKYTAGIPPLKGLPRTRPGVGVGPPGRWEGGRPPSVGFSGGNLPLTLASPTLLWAEQPSEAEADWGCIPLPAAAFVCALMPGAQKGGWREGEGSSSLSARPSVDMKGSGDGIGTGDGTGEEGRDSASPSAGRPSIPLTEIMNLSERPSWVWRADRAGEDGEDLEKSSPLNFDSSAHLLRKGGALVRELWDAWSPRLRFGFPRPFGLNRNLREGREVEIQREREREGEASLRTVNSQLSPPVPPGVQVNQQQQQGGGLVSSPAASSATGTIDRPSAPSGGVLSFPLPFFGAAPFPSGGAPMTSLPPPPLAKGVRSGAGGDGGGGTPSLSPSRPSPSPREKAREGAWGSCVQMQMRGEGGSEGGTRGRLRRLVERGGVKIESLFELRALSVLADVWRLSGGIEGIREACRDVFTDAEGEGWGETLSCEQGEHGDAGTDGHSTPRSAGASAIGGAVEGTVVGGWGSGKRGRGARWRRRRLQPHMRRLLQALMEDAELLEEWEAEEVLLERDASDGSSSQKSDRDTHSHERKDHSAAPEEKMTENRQERESTSGGGGEFKAESQSVQTVQHSQAVRHSSSQEAGGSYSLFSLLGLGGGAGDAGNVSQRGQEAAVAALSPETGTLQRGSGEVRGGNVWFHSVDTEGAKKLHLEGCVWARRCWLARRMGREKDAETAARRAVCRTFCVQAWSFLLMLYSQRGMQRETLATCTSALDALSWAAVTVGIGSEGGPGAGSFEALVGGAPCLRGGSPTSGSPSGLSAPPAQAESKGGTHTGGGAGKLQGGVSLLTSSSVGIPLVPPLWILKALATLINRCGLSKVRQSFESLPGEWQHPLVGRCLADCGAPDGWRPDGWDL